MEDTFELARVAALDEEGAVDQHQVSAHRVEDGVCLALGGLEFSHVLREVGVLLVERTGPSRRAAAKQHPGCAKTHDDEREPGAAELDEA